MTSSDIPPPAPLSRQQLARRIAEVSLLRGEFTLRSGRKSNYYLDKYRFETQPDVLLALGQLFAQHVTPATKRIAGAELGAVPLAAAASMASGLPCLFVRNQKKDYGTAKQVEGLIDAGDPVLLVEDVCTSGGQAVEAAKSLQAVGAVIQKIVVTIDRLEGGGDAIKAAGFDYAALFTIKDLGI